MDSAEIFCFLHQKKIEQKPTKFPRTEQLASLLKRTHVASEIFFFHVELWAEKYYSQTNFI